MLLCGAPVSQTPSIPPGPMVTGAQEGTGVTRPRWEGSLLIISWVFLKIWWGGSIVICFGFPLNTSQTESTILRDPSWASASLPFWMMLPSRCSTSLGQWSGYRKIHATRFSSISGALQVGMLHGGGSMFHLREIYWDNLKYIATHADQGQASNRRRAGTMGG